MYLVTNRANQYLNVIESTIRTNPVQIENIEYFPSEERPTEWEKYDGSLWGTDEQWAWFKTNFKIPAEFSGKTVVIKLVTGPNNEWNAHNPQFLVRVNGKVTQAFDTNHSILYLTENANPDEEYEVLYQGYSNGKDISFKPFLMQHNPEISRLYFNLSTAVIAAETYEKHDNRRTDIENYITATLNLIDLRIPMSDEYLKSVDEANAYIEEEFYNKFCNATSPVVAAIGHTHIDVAWLWTVAQTRHKAARTFSSMLTLMYRYPEFKFTGSQPQLYKFVKEDVPELYERIKERVKEGRWEVEGGMWLEADCNITGGESLIRQILHGKRFIKEEFDKDSQILWLPDVFGYSAALPQILIKSEIDTFVTSKISWNEYNAMPYETFSWQGIDGTEIFTQFITGADPHVKLRDFDNHYSTYNAQLKPNTIAFSWEHYHQKNINNEIITSYGYGDGGGGVTEEMLEYQRRLSHGIPGFPVTKPSTALESINNIKENVKGKKLPKWVGELYLELHRGTYTSMAKNKRYNRLLEFLLQHTETVSLANKLLLGGNYPKESLYNSWETVLLNQFHDIIPGSSIEEVYKVTDVEYAELTKKNTALSDEALASIAGNTKSSGILVYNPTSFERSEAVNYNGKTVYAENVPAFGWKIIDDNSSFDCDIEISENRIENKYYIIDIDKDGSFTRLYDKTNNREVLKEGCRANVIRAFDDHPRAHDNWEISIYYTEKMWEVNDVVSVEIIEKNKYLASLRIVKKFLNSTISQTITVYSDSPRIDFANDIDWNEHHLILKAAFPVDILADKASYEIQYGSIERPTHSNTSWDAAKFEVCAHKWADLSEPDYGAAILNDCKYGHDIHDGVISLTLLKCGTNPNKNADIGKHEFTYSFLPHNGGWREGGVLKESFALNCPLKAIPAQGGGKLEDVFSFISSSAENAVITAVKEACDSDDIIVRIYEAYGKRTNTTVTTAFDIAKVYDSNFIETKDYAEIESGKNSFTLSLKPYEIKTLRIKL